MMRASMVRMSSLKPSFNNIEWRDDVWAEAGNQAEEEVEINYQSQKT
jgi:hypothetical protein